MRLDTLEKQRQRILIERSVEFDPRRIDKKARLLVGLGRPGTERVFHVERPRDRIGQNPRLLAEAFGEIDGHP